MQHKVLFVDTPDDIQEVDLIAENQEELSDALRGLINGYLEAVHPTNLPRPYCFVCDEEGLIKNRELNIIGTKSYNSMPYGIQSIVGPIVIMKMVKGREGFDLAGLDDSEAYELKGYIRTL